MQTTDLQNAPSGVTKMQATALLAAQLCGFGIYFYQNSSLQPLGGPISLVKSFWLTYCITLWLVAPLMFTLRRSFGRGALHKLLRLLAASMVLRSVVEIYLCVTVEWSTLYGLGHDAFHATLLLAGLPFVLREKIPSVRWQGIAIVVLTLASLASEVTFVGWFRAATAGPASGIYFVPDGDLFAEINRRTAFVFLPQYAVFIAWLGSRLFRSSRT